MDQAEIDRHRGFEPCRVRAIIAGFGVPGRSVAEELERLGWYYVVIDTNEQAVQRCRAYGRHMFLGDVRQEQILLQAGVAHARLLALTMPDEAVVIEAAATARRLNPSLRILARCAYTSSGFQAARAGANEVVVAEQVVAAEFARLTEEAVRVERG